MPTAVTEFPLLEVRRLSKAFTGVQALEDVRLDIRGGEVHAIMGENGAGKSTLMKILAGLEQPDTGEIWMRGKQCSFRNAHEAMRAGIAMIHQELMPFANMTVAENIFMGQEPTRAFPGVVARRRQSADAQRLLDRLGVHLAPNTPMHRLSISEMQMVEIAKAVARSADLIIMDEPSSAISEREVDALFAIIRDLRRRGVAILYISHKLDEVFAISDRVTVLRDGHYISTDAVGALDESMLINRMAGRDIKTSFIRAAPVTGPELLAVEGLTRQGKYRDVSFAARGGEILGIAGLMGAGRTELLNGIYGLDPADRGTMRVRGVPVRIRSPQEAIRHGIGLAGEDRKESGLVLNLPVKVNITLTGLSRCCLGGVIRKDRENRVADDRIRAFGIKTADRNQPAGFLSGGNQQKIVLAKTLFTDPAILLLDEPTRGIDIRAKVEIYTIISRLAREGRAIVMVSSELREILAVSDRILVMRTGSIVAELDPAHSSQEEILRYAMPS